MRQQEQTEQTEPTEIRQSPRPALLTPTQTAVQTIAPAYADLLMATVQKEARKLRRDQVRRRAGLLSFSVLASFMLLIFVARGLYTGRWDAGMLFIFGGMSGMFSAAIAAVATNTHKTAASQLAELNEIRAVGPLAESLDIDDTNVRAVVEAGLIRLLPRLQASDAALLNTQQRACLNRALTGRNESLILAILRAYEQVGDAYALPVVEGLARETPGDPNPGQFARKSEPILTALLGEKVKALPSAQIRQAAQVCLPYLRERAEQQRARQTLLRGASANEVAPDTLLRPAAETQTAPTELLRAQE